MQSNQKKLKTAIRRSSTSASDHVATNACESLYQLEQLPKDQINRRVGFHTITLLRFEWILVLYIYIKLTILLLLWLQVLHPFSVHYSLPSSCWIATIFRHSDSYSDLNSRMRYSNFEFKTESEAKKFCKAYS